MGHPDFRANGRIFATLQHDRTWGALMLTPLVGSEFIPETDQGFTQLSLRMATGSSLERSDVKVRSCWRTRCVCTPPVARITGIGAFFVSCALSVRMT